jgi:hypothetical protein
MADRMHPETTGADLLDAAERALAAEIIPALSGDRRFAALMVAAAIRMAAREWRLAGAAALLGEDTATLSADIRAGRHDRDGKLLDRLIADATARVAMSRPAFLTADERAAAGLPDV